MNPSVVADEKIWKIHKIIVDDHKVRLTEIVVFLKISKEHVRHIAYEVLSITNPTFYLDQWIEAPKDDRSTKNVSKHCKRTIMPY